MQLSLGMEDQVEPDIEFMPIFQRTIVVLFREGIVMFLLLNSTIILDVFIFVLRMQLIII